MASSGKLYLYDTTTGAQFGTADQDGLDVFFPVGVRGWADVLDCRISPYTEQSLEENCEYAVGVRKFFILVTEQQVEASRPVTTED